MPAVPLTDSVVPLLLEGGEPGTLLALVGRHPVLVGRDAGCDVAILDPHVSRHHALLWFQEGALFLRDLGSALGTTVGGRDAMVGESIEVSAEDDIVLAGRVVLSWDPKAVPRPGAWEPSRVLQRAGDRWAATDATALYKSVPGHPLPDRDEGMTLTGVTIDWEVSLAPVEQFSLHLSIEGGVPAKARFEDRFGRSLSVTGESRVVLIYLLARRKLLYDRSRGHSPWMDDGELAIGLWGARGADLPASRLNTVVARVRDQLEKADLPRELVEKRAGETRLGGAVAPIAIEGWSASSIPALP